MNEDFSFAFDRRYLAVAVCVFLASVRIALTTNISVTFDGLLKYSVIFCCALLAAAFCICLFKRKNRRLISSVLAVVVCTVIIICGFIRVAAVDAAFAKAEDTIKDYPIVSGRVLKEPELSSTGKSINVNIAASVFSDGQNEYNCDKEIKLSAYIAKDALTRLPEIGDCIRLALNTDFTLEPVFEGDFDFSRYLRQSNTLYAGYSKNAEFISPLPQHRSVFSPVAALGIKIRQKILASTEMSAYTPDQAALLSGILVGDKGLFSDELYEKYTQSGLAHIVSVSGLHISYLYFAIMLLLSLVRFPKRFSFMTVIPLLVLFAAIALFTPSVCRAVIMMAFLLVANALGRKNDSITALSFAAAALVIQNPYVLESYSFLLSFGATAGILVFTPMILQYFPLAKIKDKKRLRPLFMLCNYVVNSVALTISGTIGIAYFSARFFGRISFGGIIANIFVFPMVAVSFVGGIINSLIYRFAGNVSWFFAKVILAPCLDLINKIAQMFSGEIFTLNVPKPHASFFPIYIIICIGMYVLLAKSDD